MKKLLFLPFIMLFMLFALPVAYGETHTLNTYYPVPFAAYESFTSGDMQFTPLETKMSTSTCRTATEKGITYFDKEHNCIMLCTGTGWKCVGATVGASGAVIDDFTSSLSSNYNLNPKPGYATSSRVQLSNKGIGEGNRLKVDFSGVYGVKSHKEAPFRAALEVFVGKSNVTNENYSKRYTMFDVDNLYDVGSMKYGSSSLRPNACYGLMDIQGNRWTFQRRFDSGYKNTPPAEIRTVGTYVWNPSSNKYSIMTLNYYANSDTGNYYLANMTSSNQNSVGNNPSLTTSGSSNINYVVFDPINQINPPASSSNAWYSSRANFAGVSTENKSSKVAPIVIQNNAKTQTYTNTARACYTVYLFKSSVLLDELQEGETHLIIYARSYHDADQASIMFSGWSPSITGINQ